MKAVRILIILLAVVTGCFFGTGLLAPSDFNGQISVTIPLEKDKVWDNLIDIEHLPQRRKDVLKIEMLGLNNKGQQCWKEYANQSQYMTFALLEKADKKKMVVQMQQSTFGMTGTWTYLIDDVGQNKTKLTVIENSRIDNIIVRAIETIAGRDHIIKDEIKYASKIY